MSISNQDINKSIMIKENEINSKKSNDNLLKLNLSQRRNSLDSTSKSTMTRSLSRPSFISNKQKSYDRFSLKKINGIRTDVFGNKIIKGSKNYKVTFIDEISREKIAQVVLIHTESKYDNLNDTENCQCNVCSIY
jgi:hypothetical protein